jgi:hypothetical protein
MSVLETITPELVAGLDPFAKQRLLLNLRKREALRKKHGILFYKPHHKQDMFHKAGAQRFRYARVGNRFGKSEMGIAEDIAWCLGERPWYAEDDPARYVGIPQRAVKGVLICVDWDKCEEIFTARNLTQGGMQGKLFRLLPQHLIQSVVTNHAGKVSRVDIKGKFGISSLYFDTVASFRLNALGHESSDWDFIHIDEPIPEEMWKAYARGLVDRMGSAWFVCTPLNEPWINDFFLPSARYKWDEAHAFVDGQKWTMHGSMRDNPYLPKEAIDEFVSQLSADEAACRIDGVPTSASGVVYKYYSPDKHVLAELPRGWKDYDDPPADYTIRYALDMHPRTSHAALFAATAPTGEVFFWHEIFEKALSAQTIRQFAGNINAALKGRISFLSICDPIAFIENPIDGRTMADELGVYGVFVEPAPKDLTRGIVAVNELLKEDKRVFFSPKLRETMWEFDRYRWNPKNPDKPIDKDDHMMECLYRLVISGLEYIDPRPQPTRIMTFGDIATHAHLARNVLR